MTYQNGNISEEEIKDSCQRFVSPSVVSKICHLKKMNRILMKKKPKNQETKNKFISTLKHPKGECNLVFRTSKISKSVNTFHDFTNMSPQQGSKPGH